ncbi:MAG: SpoVA/SpoVAEb family sporulation membrane protein, partial [Clostridia bacterium]|nr:SpoVA/SpoVAEb family sporulation membrane protein [Clostridia bacterium]
MSTSKKDYDKITKKHSPGSPLLKDCVKAFLFGGVICLIGEGLFYLYSAQGADEKTGRTLVSLTLIAVTSFLTAIGVFDKIAKHAGAGTFVPITGFANAVVS